jgi:ElaB/YqjD/DUF883 family membrane-anchored ribosome-binding protein
MAATLRDDVVRDLTEAVNRAMDRIGEGIDHTARDARRLAHASEGAASHAAREFVHDARELAHDVGEESRRVALTARREVRDHPLAAVAVGAAIGALFGILIAQRR